MNAKHFLTSFIFLALLFVRSFADTSLPDAALGRAKDLASKVGELNEQTKELGVKIDQKGRDLVNLKNDETRKLDEYRRGEFCSGCGKTRSEILALGQQFPHRGEHVIRATAEQIAEKQRELEGPIAEMQHDLTAMQRDYAALSSQRRELMTRELPDAVLAWKSSVNTEENKLLFDWQKSEADYRSGIKKLNQEYTEADAQNKPTFQNLIRGLTDQQEQRELQFRQDRSTLDAAKTSGRQELSEILSRIDGPYLVPPASVFGMPSTPIRAGSFEMTVSIDQILVGVSLGSMVKGKLGAQNDFFKDSMTLKVGLEFGGASGFEAGMQHDLKFDRDGVKTTETPYLKTPGAPPQ